MRRKGHALSEVTMEGVDSPPEDVWIWPSCVDEPFDFRRFRFLVFGPASRDFVDGRGITRGAVEVFEAAVGFFRHTSCRRAIIASALRKANWRRVYIGNAFCGGIEERCVRGNAICAVSHR